MTFIRCTKFRSNTIEHLIEKTMEYSRLDKHQFSLPQWKWSWLGEDGATSPRVQVQEEAGPTALGQMQQEGDC